MRTSREPLRHPLALLGAAITTASAVGFLVMAAASAIGFFNHPYAGLVVYVALPALFLAGLALIPAGLWLQRRARARDPSASLDWPVVDLRRQQVRRTVLAVIALTAVNLGIVALAGYGTLRWMESPEFCGQTCHTPMHPQFAAWQASSHAEVACVRCHIGDGGRALVHYKLAGVRQLYHVVIDEYPRPIPAQADLRPAIETCGTCHAVTRGHGDRSRVIREYADDEAGTETATELLMHVGGPSQPTPSGRAIHWHADPELRVEYIATDPDRQDIPFVKVTRGGESKEYVIDGTTPETLAAGESRVMDCTDCHSGTGHRIAPTAEQAVDRAIAAGQLARRLPFVRREGVRLVKAEYGSQDEALAAIERELRAFYQEQADRAAVGQAVAGIQRVYRHNVFPAMKVTWGTYTDNRGHITSNGCFRCHDDSHVAKDGSTISADCSYCHEQRATP